jgi:hypothetical protein
LQIVTFDGTYFFRVVKGASFVYDKDFGRDVLQLNGAGEYALTPAVKLQKTDFVIEMWFKSTDNGKRQFLFADWSKPWQFLIAIKASGKIQVTLRRNINSGGSDPNQDLVTAIGGSVKRDAWQHLVVTYINKSGTCVVHLNDATVASVTTKWPNHDLQENSHLKYEVGYKKDSGNEFFKGRIGFLRVNDEVFNQNNKSRYFHLFTYRHVSTMLNISGGEKKVAPLSILQ